MSTPIPVDPKAHLLQLRIIHIAMCVAPLMMGVIFYFMRSGGMDNPELSGGNFFAGMGIMTIVGLAIFSMMLPLSMFVFTTLITKIDPHAKLEEKLIAYRSPFIVRIAMIEGAAMACLVMYFIEGHLLMLLLAFAAIVFMAMQHPSVDKLSQALNLDQSEVRQLTQL